jgi:hypothetical protein
VSCRRHAEGSRHYLGASVCRCGAIRPFAAVDVAGGAAVHRTPRRGLSAELEIAGHVTAALVEQTATVDQPSTATSDGRARVGCGLPLTYS